jgi:hypothetical protein
MPRNNTATTATAAADVDAQFAEDADLDMTAAENQAVDDDGDDEIDLSVVRQPNRNPIPRGTYRMVVVGGKPGRTPAPKNTPFVGFQVKPLTNEAGEETYIDHVVVKNPDGSVKEEYDEEIRFDAKRVWPSLYFTEKSMWATKPVLEVLGVPADFKGSRAQIAEMTAGAHFIGVVDIEQSPGINKRTGQPYEPRNVITAYLPDGAATSIESLLG